MADLIIELRDANRGSGPPPGAPGYQPPAPTQYMPPPLAPTRYMPPPAPPKAPGTVQQGQPASPLLGPAFQTPQAPAPKAALGPAFQPPPPSNHAPPPPAYQPPAPPKHALPPPPDPDKVRKEEGERLKALRALAGGSGSPVAAAGLDAFAGLRGLMAGGAGAGLGPGVAGAGLAASLGQQIADAGRRVIEAQGQHYARIVKLDTSLFGEEAQKVAAAAAEKAFGGFGIAGAPVGAVAGGIASEMVKSMQGVNEGLLATAKRLAPYGGQLAGAEGMAQARQVEGELKRAAILEAGLSRLVDVNSRMEQTMQTMLARLSKAPAERMAALLEKLAPILDMADEALKKWLGQKDEPGPDVVDEFQKAAAMRRWMLDKFGLPFMAPPRGPNPRDPLG